jgi:hypothetical protein
VKLNPSFELEMRRQIDRTEQARIVLSPAKS